jgi:hypothetical protein
MDELRGAHAALGREVDGLRAAAGPEPEAVLADVRARLTAVRVRAGIYFRLEEEGGYMGAVRQREPRLERSILQLAAEHSELLRSLDGIICEAARATDLDAGLRGRIITWAGALGRHEDRENRLIEDAFDLGPGD